MRRTFIIIIIIIIIIQKKQMNIDHYYQLEHFYITRLSTERRRVDDEELEHRHTGTGPH
jgi:hypothetical protein